MAREQINVHKKKIIINTYKQDTFRSKVGIH